MQLDDDKAELLKRWIINKLESASDADSDVLADYVLALIRTDEPEAVAKANCIDNLRDFLADNAPSFVEDVFTAIKTQAYDPSKPKLKINQAQQQVNGSRKRSRKHLDESSAQDTYGQTHGSAQRPAKHPRRARNGSERGQRNGRQHQFQYSGLASFPTPNFGNHSGVPTLDAEHPLATIIAMHQALGLPIPDLNSTSGLGYGSLQGRQRCRDYDIKGYCAVGASCPYEHSAYPVVAPPVNGEYNLLPQEQLSDEPPRGGTARNKRGRWRSSTHANRRNGGRAEFSQPRPPTRGSNTAIVVEQIPDEFCSENTVRDFFEAFGPIQKTELQPHRHLAIVTYANAESARAAHRSPKAIFDNRFVKVFWYNPSTGEESHDGGSGVWDQEAYMEEGVPDIDPEEFTQRQEEAQRKHEETIKLRGEAEKQKLELDAKLIAIEQERKRLKTELAAKTGGEGVNEDAKEESEQAKALKAQLAELEAEAVSLGIDPNISSNEPALRYSYHARGGYRGRGGWRGRGTSWQRGKGRAVKNLDNRPRAVAVIFADGSYNSHEEALRQYLLFSAPESSTLAEHPQNAGAALVQFQERWQAEVFIDAAKSKPIPHLGRVELAWYKSSDADATNGRRTSIPIDETATEGVPPEFEVQSTRDLDTYGEEDGAVH